MKKIFSIKTCFFEKSAVSKTALICKNACFPCFLYLSLCTGAKPIPWGAFSESFLQGSNIKSIPAAQTRTKFVPVVPLCHIISFDRVSASAKSWQKAQNRLALFARNTVPSGRLNKKQHPPSPLRWEGVVFNEVEMIIFLERAKKWQLWKKKWTAKKYRRRFARS